MARPIRDIGKRGGGATLQQEAHPRLSLICSNHQIGANRSSQGYQTKLNLHRIDVRTALQQKFGFRIVVRPWSHGRWARSPAQNLGDYEFGSDTAKYYQREIEAPFFAHYLKDEGELKLPEALMFQTGANQWKRYEAWPPRKRVHERQLFLQVKGGLLFDSPPASHNGYASHLSDPAKPVPYSKRPIMGFWSGLKGSKDPRFGRAGKLWKVEDQRFVSDQPDVLSFLTEPLEKEVEIAGRMVAHLFTSTTGTACDWVVKLIDVYPENDPDAPQMGGFQLMIADDVLRAKFHQSFEEPAPLKPGEVTEFKIDLCTRNHLFRKGHRIMVQVQSTWFPLIDRNPQTYVDIPKAHAEDYRKAEQRIYFTKSRASYIQLPAVNGD